jgi:WD40 repeat protein
VTKADPKLTHLATSWKYSSPLISCRFDPKGRFLFTSSENYSLQRWDLSTGKSISFAGHDSWAFSLAVSPDGQTLISGGGDGKLIWWPATAETPKPIRAIDAHHRWIRALAISPDGTLLATGGNDSLVKLWNMADGTLVRELDGHSKEEFNYIYSLLFHPSGKFLLSGDLLGKIKQTETATGKLIREFDAKALHTYNGGQRVHYGGVRSLAISPDGKYLTGGGLYKATNPLGAINEPLVLRFDWETQKLKVSHVASGVRGIGCRCLFNPDGYLIAASGGGGGGFLLIWNDTQDKEIFKLKLPNTARDLDLHPDGIRLATIHHDGQVRISRMAKKETPPAKTS